MKTNLSALLQRNRIYILYGTTLAILLFILKWLEFRLLIMKHSFEVYAGAIALIFTLLGIWVAGKLTNPKIIIIEKKTFEFLFNEAEFSRLGISKREMEVLELMAKGFSNNEIAGKLFLSESTIKSHAARLFEKLDVKRRTQAVDKAKQLRLIP